MRAGPRADRRERAVLFAILAVGLGLRIAHWLSVREHPLFSQLVMDSREYDAWARRLAGGDWLGNEAFFQAPLYPYLVGLVYRALGRSVDAVCLLQIAASTAALAALRAAARRAVSPAAGLAAAALGAAYGPWVFHDAQLLKDSLAAAAAALLLACVGRARDAGGGAARWLLAGVVLGFLVQLRENALILVVLFLPFAWRRDDRVHGLVRRGAAFLAGVAAVALPIAVRNDVVSGSFLPTTFNPGVTFYIGNNAGADGSYRPLVPGRQVPAYEKTDPVTLAEREVGRHLSPGEVSRHWLRKAFAWIAANPADAARLTWRKAGLFFGAYERPDAVDYYHVRTLSPALRLPLLEWAGAGLLAIAGVALSRGRLGPLAPAIVLVLGLAAATIPFFLFARYRLPAVPGLLVLAAIPIAKLVETKGSGRIALAALLALAFLGPRFLGHEPRMDLVNVNLGRLAEERGDDAEAARLYRAALKANAGDFLATLGVGNVAARARDYETARVAFSRAAALQPRSPEAWSNLGGAAVALAKWDEAEAALRKALELDPGNAAARRNLEALNARRAAAAGAP